MFELTSTSAVEEQERDAAAAVEAFCREAERSAMEALEREADPRAVAALAKSLARTAEAWPADASASSDRVRVLEAIRAAAASISQTDRG